MASRVDDPPQGWPPTEPFEPVTVTPRFIHANNGLPGILLGRDFIDQFQGVSFTGDTFTLLTPA